MSDDNQKSINLCCRPIFSYISSLVIPVFSETVTYILYIVCTNLCKI